MKHVFITEKRLSCESIFVLMSLCVTVHMYLCVCSVCACVYVCLCVCLCSPEVGFQCYLFSYLFTWFEDKIFRWSRKSKFGQTGRLISLCFPITRACIMSDF